jgi:hypothetical protein
MRASNMRNRKNQRGVALVYISVVFGAVVAVMAIAVDIARLSWNASEVQAVADASALSGALGLGRKTFGVNTPTPIRDAQTAASANQYNAQYAILDANDITIGTYHDGAFTPSSLLNPQANAVQTRPHVPVSNLLSGSVFHAPVTDVHKQATAAFCTLGAAVPTLPIALADGCFQCFPTACPPSIFVLQFNAVPLNNAAWFYPTSTTGSPGIDAYVPSCPNGGGGGGQTMPTVSTGTVLSLNNGSLASLCQKDFQCLVGQSFVLPVVHSQCSVPLSGSDPIVGFATVTLVSTACPQLMTMTITFNDHTQGTVDCDTCPTCGTGRVALAQ